MMSAIKREREKVNPALLGACAKNLSLDLRVIGEKPQIAYRSRFLGVSTDAEESLLAIEAPAQKGSIVPIRPGSEIRISFENNDQDNYFMSTVLRRGRFQLNEQTSVPSLEIDVPDDVFSGGKRSYYRIALDNSEPIEVKLGILADDDGGTGRIRWRQKGMMTDIGGGGLGFRIPQGKSLLISPGTRLVLIFRLSDSEEEIKLRGRVCFSLRRPELRRAFFGTQFIDIESDIMYKQNVDKILHFVAREQRRRLGERAQSTE